MFLSATRTNPPIPSVLGPCSPLELQLLWGAPRERHESSGMTRLVSVERLLSWRRKRWSQIFEHGEVSHVEGCQLQPLDIRGRCDEVIAQSNAGVTAVISAHHLAGTTGDYFRGRFCAKG